MRGPGLACALALLLSIPLAPGCRGEAGERPGRAGGGLEERDWVGPELPRGQVILRDAFGTAHVVQVEIAATEDTRRRGLMWRTALEPGQGMVFLFPEEAEHSFWMKNTLIPLDMIFIDERLRVVGVIEQAPIRSTRLFSVGRDSRYVLEVPGGWAQRAGIGEGARVEFHLGELTPR